MKPRCFSFGNTAAPASSQENSKWRLGLGGNLGDIDPLKKVPFKRATGRVQKGPL